MRKASISQVDAIFTNGSYPIEFLFYYKNRLKTEKVRSALRRLSIDFWPAFGEYETGLISFDGYSEKDCFGEDIIDRDFRREDPDETIYESYGRSIPWPMKRLFFLKIIQVRNGTLLIPKMNHLAGDGYSYFYLLSAGATLCRNAFFPLKEYLNRAVNKPHHNRTALKEFRFEDPGASPAADPEKLHIEFDRISRAKVQGIKRQTASEFGRPVSGNDILSAMAVKKLTQVQHGLFGENVELTMPMDVRHQVQGYGPKYFGNGLMFHTVTLKAVEINQKGISEIAIDIRTSMPAVTRVSYFQYLAKLEDTIAARRIEKLRPYDPQSGCLVTNLSKLPASKLDFGTGAPDFIFPLTIEKNSAAILADREDLILRYAY